MRCLTQSVTYHNMFFCNCNCLICCTEGDLIILNLDKMPNRIESELKRKGISKTDLGNALGVSDVTVGYWCHGKRIPPLQQVISLSEYFGVSIDYLVGLSDYPNRAPSLTDELGLSDLAIANMRSMASAGERRSLLNKLLEFSGLSSVFGNIALAHKLRGETSGNIQTVNLPAELQAEVGKHGYVILSNRESADYLEDKALGQLLQAFNRRG